MSTGTTIYEGKDFYVPEFRVVIGQEELSREVIFDITQVSYRDSMDKVDSFEITISNWDAKTRTFKYSDGDRFNPGKQIELWMGYRSHQSRRLMLSGAITQLRPTFPSGGQPTLAISGVNQLHQLRRSQESYHYSGRTASEIAKEVAGRLSMPIETPNESEEKPFPYMLQGNQYDISFLMSLARRMGYVLYIKEPNSKGQPPKSTLVFGRSETGDRPEYMLKYGESLIDFTPTLSTARQVNKVEVHSRDNVNGQAITAEASRSDVPIQGASDEVEGAVSESFRDRVEVIYDQPVDSVNEGKDLARDTMERIVREMITGHGSTVGLPDLRAGNAIFLDGLGKRFNGRYFVTGTNHTIGDNGYITAFDCRREELRGGRSG